MRRIIHARLLASALVVGGMVPFVAVTTPAQAQDYGEVSFDSFHDQLEQYGYWVYSDRWGLVWQPADVPGDFRPYYSAGHWVYTDDYGWYWASDFPWGDIAFHYGRWVDDPDDGWLWMPGYTWSPGWVVWRSNGQYVGWMPAPPDRAFLEGGGDVSFGLSFGGGGISFGWNNDPYYGYRAWYGRDFDERRFANDWVFVGTGHMADRDYRRVAVRDPVLVVAIIHRTRDMSHYSVVNNYVVNKSIDVHLVERAAGHPIQITPARSVIRQPNLVMRVDQSRRIQMQQRAVAPHGTGLPNSAPPPSSAIVGKLSNQAAQHNGQTSSHLFTRSTVSSPEVQSHFRGAPARGGAGGMNGPGTGGTGGQNGMQGPGGNNPETRHREQGQPGNETGPGGMGGPGPGGTGGQNGMQGPGGNNPETRHREQGQPGNETGPGGMGGPGPGGTGGQNGMQGPGGNNPETRHREQGQPGNEMGPGGMGGPGPGGTGAQNGMQGPGGNNPETRHREQVQPGNEMSPGGMGGPGPGGTGGQSGMQGPGGNTPETRHREQGQQGSPGGMSGPGGQMGGPQNPPRPAAQPPSGPNAPASQTEEKKKHKPDQPPGTPPQ